VARPDAHQPLTASGSAEVVTDKADRIRGLSRRWRAAHDVGCRVSSLRPGELPRIQHFEGAF
jgi:hypothetical protein